MASVAGTVAGEDHGLAAQCPFCIAVAVAAVGQVVGFLLSAGVDESHVRTVPSANADVACQQPAAVRAPLHPQVTVGVGVVETSVKYGTYLLTLEVHDAQVGTILKEGYLLAVRTVFGLLRDAVSLRQLCFLQCRSVGELLLVLATDGRLEYLPHAVALGGIDKTSAVRGEVDVAFLLGRVGYAFRRLVVERCNVDVTVHDEGYFLAFGREAYLRGSACDGLPYQFSVVTVCGDADVYALLLSVLPGVYLAVVAIAQCAVVGSG